MALYATLAEAKEQLAANATADDNKLLRQLRTASRRLDREFGAKRPLFEPYVETRRVYVTGDTVNSAQNTLALPGGLLELTGVTLGGSALVVGTHVLAYPDASMPPFPFLRLATTLTGQGWYDYCASDGAPLAAVITGIWGVHRDYGTAWTPVDALAAGINASVVSLTVADVDGAGLYGVTPRISPGNLLKIESEFLEVTATDTNANTATVIRGANGSTAATHSMGASVSVWQVEEPVRMVVARQAGLMLSRLGAYTTVEINGMSEVRYPPDLLTELRGILREYAYL